MSASRAIQTASRKYCWLCIAIGLVAAWVEFSLLDGSFTGTLEMVGHNWPEFGTGIIALFILSYPTATSIGSLAQRRPSLFFLLCPIISVILIGLAAASGGIVGYFVDTGFFQENISDYTIRPAGAVCLFGSLPAIGLGLLWAHLLKQSVINARIK